MKKLVVLLFIVLLLAACSDEFYKHDSIEIPYIPAE